MVWTPVMITISTRTPVRGVLARVSTWLIEVFT